jgi:hydrogenase nickel insertion protein HypA
MHELPILRSIVGVASKYATSAGAERVVAITLEVGELRDLDEAWMQRYFAFASTGTPAAGATLRVRRSRALFLCQVCSGTFGFDLRSGEALACPACSSAQVELTTGNELRIESIDVADEGGIADGAGVANRALAGAHPA